MNQIYVFRKEGSIIDRYTVFDLEMPNRAGDRISAVGIAVIEDGEIVDEYYSLVNPEAGFDKYTIKITGITPAMVANEPPFPVIWEEIRPYFEDSVLAAHSVQCDMHVLANCLKSYGIQWKNTADCVCTLELGNLCYPDFVSHRLDAMCETLDIELDHHNAGSDALGAAFLLLDYMENGIDPAEHILSFDMIRSHAVRRARKPFPRQVEEEVRESLTDMLDEETRRIKLAELKELPEDAVIGVPVARIKQYASEMLLSAKANEFVKLLPHRFLEENDLHACILNNRKKFTTVLSLVDGFLPYIDNAETCSLLDPKAFRRRQPELKKKVNEWLASYRPFTARFGLETAIRHFITDVPDEELLETVCALQDAPKEVTELLPVFFAAALARQYEPTLKLLEEHRLPAAIHNKTIMKYLADEKAPKNRKLRVKELMI